MSTDYLYSSSIDPRSDDFEKELASPEKDDIPMALALKQNFEDRGF